VFKSAREPPPRHQTGQFQQVKPGMRPDVLRLDDKTRAHGRPIEPNICQAVDLALAAGDEAAAETERAMEFARMANNANASRIERGCDIIAEPRLYRTSVPPYYDWLGSPFAGFHHPPRFDPCYNDRNSYDDCKFVEVGDLQRSVRSSRFPIIGSRNSKGAADSPFRRHVACRVFGAAGLVARHWMRTLRYRASLHSSGPLWGGLRFKKPPIALPPPSRLEMYAAVVHPQLEAAEPRVVRQVPATQRHRILIRLGRESLDRFYSAGGTEQV
jgi:hypothetical protein